MPIDSGNLALKGLDDLFSTEENRQEEQREQVQQIPIDELHPFTNHPFKVLDDEAMTRTVESIAQYGVLAPLIARPRPVTATRSSPGTAVSMQLNLPGWIPCRSLCGRCRTMLL